MKNVFIELTSVAPKKGLPPIKKWVNMSRCQEIDPPEMFTNLDQVVDAAAIRPNAILTMNIPDCYIAVMETPAEVVALLAAVNGDDDGSR